MLPPTSSVLGLLPISVPNTLSISLNFTKTNKQTNKTQIPVFYVGCVLWLCMLSGLLLSHPSSPELSLQFADNIFTPSSLPLPLSLSPFLSFFFSFFRKYSRKFFCLFVLPLPRHVGVPRPDIKPELQQWQYQVLNPLHHRRT